MSKSDSLSLKKQVLSYVFFGFCATGTDYFFYNILININTFNYSISKGLSFLAGTIVSYFLNKYFTFKVNKKSCKEFGFFMLLYLISMISNVFTNDLSLILFEKMMPLEWALRVSFCIATFVSMLVNFMGQKFWIFAP